MLVLPEAARFVLWANAVLSGATSFDEAADQAATGGTPIRVRGVPGEADAVGITLALGRLRTLGTGSLRLVLPVPGDLCGLAGPSSFNQVAVAARAAALTCGGVPLGLVPVEQSWWQVHHVTTAPPPTLALADADRMLRQELRECTAALVALDVAHWRPEVADLLVGQPGGAAPGVPPPASPQALHLLAQAQRVAAIVTLATETAGGAVTAGEMAARSAVLRRLDVAVRRATEAACNSAFERG